MENERVIMCIDLKSFYASVECVDRGLNPFTIPLVVADKSRGGGSIILAVSPYLRNLGVPSRLRIFELPSMDDIIFAPPRMERYLYFSSRVIDIFLEFIAPDDLHIYSCDESFLDLTHYLKYYNLSAYDLAKKIKKRIFDELKLTCTIGIGGNLLLAKISMDIDSKHTPEQIAYWKKEDIQKKLWKIYPLSKMWGIGKNYERRLNTLGLYTVGDVANSKREILVQKFGVIGGQLHDHCNGIDDSDIRKKYIPTDTSLTSGQVFFRDYTYDEVPLIIRESLDDLVLRLVYSHKIAAKIMIFVGYSKVEMGGFAHSTTLDCPSDDVDYLFQSFMAIYNKYVEDRPIRRVSIVLSELHPKIYNQYSLFENAENSEKKMRLFITLGEIKNRYGKNAVLRTSSQLKGSNIILRHGLVGGHKK